MDDSRDGRRPVGDGVLIGIDIGSSRSKGVACRADGQVVASAVVAHTTSMPRAGWFEHDADAIWWADLAKISRGLMAALGPATQIAAMAVTTCGPCLVPVDGEGRPLRPGILYDIDTRARHEIELFEQRIGRRAIRALTGMPLSSQSIGPKIAWVIAHEPDVARRVATWHTATSYLVRRLTGRAVIDHHQAAYFGPFVSARRREWDLRHARDLDLGGRLPDRAWPSDVAGAVTPDAARLTGLPAGTPVLVGTSDGPTEALAVGADRPGIASIAHGSTTIVTTFDRPARPGSGLWETDGWSPDARCLSGGLSASGAIVAWFRRELARDLVASDGSPDAFAALEAEAAESPPGANGLLVLPSFGGERGPVPDPLARGVIAGLTLAHTRADLQRAVLEGIGFGVRHLLEAFAAAGIQIDELRGAGGGTRSELGLRVVADVTGIVQQIPRETIGASRGAALLAGRAVGLVGRGDDRDNWFQLDREIRPDRRLTALYDERYALFRRLYRDSRSVVHDLATAGLGVPR